ncbi:beta-glucosidase [Vibrio sp. HA2012]|uniref:glycoside hydrolase family 1 protein n=1 Tax=Vibrio sp. HA2012 TaxID=1971595 RepID=UPI000C2C355D|nr:family 1 glycosylhydrolase [Vibrio sp. HA2012]PJC87202.1 beta-glucosidase [Vibrio sp. HA2012]
MFNHKPGNRAFSDKFMWGAAGAGHQIEGNNVNADIWLMEHVPHSIFSGKSGDACNSFELWETDLDLAKELGFTAYRFSIEWARIEPECGCFSLAMLKHYEAIIDGCLSRNMVPVVTLNHFANPVWFARKGGWTNPEASQFFVRYCDYIGEHIGKKIKYAMTFNEPNILRILKAMGMPEEVWEIQDKTLDEAAQLTDSKTFSGLNVARREDFELMMSLLIEGHKVARETLKKHNPDMQVGFSLAMLDDQPLGENSLLEQKRKESYGDWFDAAEFADFIGIQNYERVVWDDKGSVPVPDDAMKNATGSWIDPTSLANCVAYVYQRTQKPIFVTEHGMGTDNDNHRETFLRQSLVHLMDVVEEGIPVLGYIHWTLMDNFEWIHGYGLRFGLCSVDRNTFERTPKASAYAYRDMILKNQF